MKYCVKCVMPDTRPGIALNGGGGMPRLPILRKKKKYQLE